MTVDHDFGIWPITDGMRSTCLRKGKTTSPVNISSRTRAIAGIKNVSFIVCKRTAFNGQRSRERRAERVASNPACCCPTPPVCPRHLPRLPVGWSINISVTLCLSTIAFLTAAQPQSSPSPTPTRTPLPSLGPSQQEASNSKITTTSTTTRSSKQPHRPATALSARTDHLHTSTSIFIYCCLNFSYLTLSLSCSHRPSFITSITKTAAIARSDTFSLILLLSTTFAPIFPDVPAQSSIETGTMARVYADVLSLYSLSPNIDSSILLVFNSRFLDGSVTAAVSLSGEAGKISSLPSPPRMC